MAELYLIIIGLIFLAWLYALVRQTQRGGGTIQTTPPRPVVPVTLVEDEEAVVVSEGRGRIVYANEPARKWFDINGGVANLDIMSRQVYPADTLNDLVAGAGYASFRLGERLIEAVSHPIPGPQGAQTVVVMREMTARGRPAHSDFDPLRALAIVSDITQTAGITLDLDAVLNAILRSLEPTVAYDGAEILLWDAPSGMLRSAVRSIARVPTGLLSPPVPPEDSVYQPGEGYTGWVALYRQPLLIDNVTARADVQPKGFQARFASYAGVPLLAGDQLVGVLEVLHHRPAIFTQRDIALLQSIAPQAAVALQAARRYQDQTARVTELRGLQQIADAMSQLGQPGEIFGQLTQRIAALMDVELCGVLLADENNQIVRSQPPFYGVPDSLIDQYRLVLEPDSELERIWRDEPWWYTNDPASPVIQALGFDDLRSAVALDAVGLVPLIAGARRIGWVMVANKHDQAPFNESDMQTLASFASQAAVVAENTRLYAEQERRTRELGGLQQIAQVMGVLRNPAELYAQITARVAALMEVDLCGVLLYDADDQLLVSQMPFYGMDDVESVNFYQIPSPPGGPVARLWQDREMWFSNDLRRDPQVADTDLAQLAAAAGIRQMAMATLMVGGNRLGVIQVANRAGGANFTEDDARLLSIFAGQAATLIDNARLYLEMQQRTHEAEGLRAVTEIASQLAPLDETIEAVLIAIANLLESDVVMLGLVDHASGDVVIGQEYVWGASLDEPVRISAYAPGFEDSVLMTRRPIISNVAAASQDVPLAYRPLVDQLKLRSVIQVPMIVRDRSMGELTVGNKARSEDFVDSDVDLLLSIGTQVAAMIDRMELVQSTDQDLRARLQELDALNRVSYAFSQAVELEHIVDVIRQEILRSTGASGVSMALLTDPEDWPLPDQPLISRRFGDVDDLPDPAPVEQATVLRGSVLLVSDYASVDYEPVPAKARSALVVPVMLDGQPAGLLHLYSLRPEVFTEPVVNFVLALADQATIAIGNVRRYQAQLESNRQLRVRAEQMGRIFDLGERFRQGASLTETLDEVAHSIQETIGFNLVLISQVDESAGVLRRIAHAGLAPSVFEEMQQVTPPLEQLRGLMQDLYRISNSYFLPAEGSEALLAGVPIVQVLQERMGAGPSAWDPQDLLLVPIYGSRGRIVGLISVDEPRSGRRPDLDIVAALEIFASQAAFSIENYRLIDRIQQEAKATRRERDRLAQLHLIASQIQQAPDMPARLQVVAEGIRQAGWGKVIITLRDEHLEPTLLIHAGYEPPDSEDLATKTGAGDVWRAWINDLEFHEHKLGAGYYLRYDRPWVQEHVLHDQVVDRVADDDWHPRDVVYLPLIGQDQKRIIGIIDMRAPADGRVPTEASLQPFDLFASQAAAAIETTRLYQATLRAAEQEQRLNEVMEVVSASTSPEAVIQALSRGLQQWVSFTRMSVALLDAETGQFDVLRADIASDASVTVSADAPLPLDGTATGAAFRSTRAHVYRLQRETKARASRADLQAWYEAGERSTLLVPMVAGGQAIGAMRLGSALEDAPGFRDNLEMVQRLANLSAVALENARLFEQVEQRAVELNAQAQRLSLMNRIATRLAQAVTPGEIYQIALAEMQEVFGAQFGGVIIYENNQTGLLTLDTHPTASTWGTVRLKLSDNPSTSLVQRTRRPVTSSDVMIDPAFVQDRPLLAERGTRAMVIVPLIVAREVIGSIGLDFTEPRTFSEAEIDLAQAIASQVSVALDKANLIEVTAQRASELNAQAERLTVLNRISARLAQSLDPQEIYRMILTDLQRALNFQSAGLMLVLDDGTSSLVMSTNPKDAGMPDDIRLPLSENPVARFIIETQQPLVSPDVMADPRFESMWNTLKERNTRAMMIVPVIMGNQVIATIGLDSTVPRAFEDTEIELALTAANQAAVAIEKARLFMETQNRAEEMDAQARRMALLNRVSARLAETLDAGEIYAIVLSELAEALDVQLGGLVLFETEQEGRLVLSYPLDEPTPDLKLNLAGNLSIERVIQTQRPLVSDDVLHDPLFEQAWDVLRLRGTQSLMTIPLLVGGQVIGTIGLDATSPRRFTDTEIELAQTIANQASVAIEKARLFTETQQRAVALDEQAQRLALLNRVSLALAQSLDLENILEIALREAAITLDVPEGSAIYIDNENVLGRVIVEYPRGDLPPDTVFDLTRNAAILNIRENLIPLVVPDVDADPLHADLRALMRSPDVVSTLLVPLVMGGNVIGVLRLDAVDAQHIFTDEQVELAQTIASQAAIAVQNAALFEQSASRAKELETLFESAQATAATLDLDEVTGLVAHQMVAALRSELCTVFLWDDVANELLLQSVIDARPASIALAQQGDRIPLASLPLHERTLRERELIIVRADDEEPQQGALDLEQADVAASRMLIPLVVSDVSIGLIEVETLDENHYFRADDVRMARTMASQAATSIENARLQTETRRTVEELYIINDMSTALSSATSLEGLLAVVKNQLPGVTDADVIYVALYDSASEALSFPLAHSVLEDRPLELAPRPLGRDEFSTVIRRQAPLLLAGDDLDDVRRSLGIETLAAGSLCFLGVPLFAGEKIIGVLAVRDDDDPRAFGHNDQRILTTVGAQLGIATQSTRLFEQTLELAEDLDQRVRERTAELEQERHHISTLYQITTELSTSLDVERLLERALEMVAESVGATRGAILALDPLSSQLQFRARVGWSAQESGAEPPALRADQGLAGWAIQKRQALMVDNVQTDSRWLRLNEADDAARAALVVPIEASEDMLGVISLTSDQEAAFRPEHLRLVSAAASQVATAMNNAELYSLIRDQAERLGAMLRQEQVEAAKSGAILDSVADGVMVADAAGQVIVFNSTAERILRLASDEVLNLPTSAVSGLYGPGAARWTHVIERWGIDPTVYQPGEFLEEQFTLDDDRVISVRLSPVHMGDQFLGTVSVFRDITREVEVDRLKSEFVATVSHELRTPMTSIKGYADLLLLGAAGTINDQQQHFLETIKQNADRLSILVNDLLDISRIDQGRLELRFAPIAIKSVLEMVAGHIRGRSEDEKRPMTVQVDLPDDQALTVWGDYDKVARIVMNLADNAFNYTLDNGTITLGASYQADTEHVIISVADTGIGIPPEVGERVFDRFVRGDETQDLVMDTPGTGLGLSIVRELVAMHNGRIWFDSQVGVGTTFYVVLPARAVDAEPEDSQQ